MRTANVLLAMCLAGLLAACGGGGGGEPASCGTMLHSNPCGTTGASDTATGSVASIVFVVADTTNIALKGTGGAGRQEFSTLVFEAHDASGNPVAGATLDFTFSYAGPTQPTGGLSLLPASATTGSDGRATTVVSAGTIPTSVRVVASVRGTSPAITTLSNELVISTGVPDDRHFSLAASVGYCEGLNYDQPCTTITATLGDHFGNPVPDGTAVNFTTEGGIIQASCVTGSMPPSGPTPVGQLTDSVTSPVAGRCSVVLYSSSPRPLDGRVTVLAYALGEESFFDTNGNNVYDVNEPFNDLSQSIFRDDNENRAWTAGEPCVAPSNASCFIAGDGQYNGVLRTPAVAPNQALYLSRELVVVFSGSAAQVNVTPAAVTCAAGASVDVLVDVADVNGNAMPAGTKIDFTASFGSLSPSSVKVADLILGIGSPGAGTTYSTTLTCPAPLTGPGRLFVTVTTPNGVVTQANARIN